MNNANIVYLYGNRKHELDKIRNAGQHLIDNAENILGTFPGAGVSELVLTFKYDCDLTFPELEIKRTHLLDVSPVIKEGAE